MSDVADATDTEQPAEVGPPDMTDQYNTTLSVAQEAKFQKWASENGKYKDLFDYDLRGAWADGAQKSANGHLPDTYKKPNHPTFSKESKYSGPGHEGGEWVKKDGKWEFKASKTNVDMHGEEALRNYFDQVESGNTLTLPEAQ